MMVGGGVEEDLAPDEPRPGDEWPSSTNQTHLDLTNKDGSSSRLLFLTVQYVEEEQTTNFNTGLESFPELNQRVVSPLDPNMGCTASYSPVYRPASPLMPVQESPSVGYLSTTSPPPSEGGMIVLSEPISNQLGGSDNFVVTAEGRVYSQEQVTTTDEGKLLLLSTDGAQPTELVVAAEDCGDQKVELLLSNGTIAYGIMESADANGARVIQIPREYLVSARAHTNDLSAEEVAGPNPNVQVGNVQDENTQFRAIYDTLKEHGLYIEQGELRLESELDPNQQLMEQSLNSLPVMEPISQPQPQPVYPQAAPQPLPPSQRRYWCEECNELLDSDCSEHQVNRKITDKAVPSRARATLPAAYLVINSIPGPNGQELGVFARKTIPKRTQFGPIEGVLLKSEDVVVVHNNPQLQLSVEFDTGELKTMDVSNENMSNWMRFVRMASKDRQPNLLLSQLGTALYFTTTQMIHQREELLVWYSPSYAMRRSLPLHPPPIEWSCSMCDKKLKTADELAKHSDCHKNDINSLFEDIQQFLNEYN